MRINYVIIASLKNEATVSELEELREWRQASAANERYYQDLVRTWKLVQGGDDGIVVRSPPGINEILSRSERSSATVELLPPSATPARVKRWARSRWIRYAAAVVAGLGFWAAKAAVRSPGSGSYQLGADEFVTGASETATVSLKDGTVVRVAPSSSLSIPEASDGDRHVALKGRAFFAVAHDKSHPFHIRTDAGSVTVLGTRFDLRVHERSLRVVVLEGVVALSAGGHEIRVHQGEMGRILDGTLLPAVKVPDPVAAMDWVGRFLAFQDTPLEEVAREVQREYGVRVQITDTSLVSRTVTGWFADKKLDDVLHIACAVAAVQCVHRNDLVTITPLSNGSPPDTGSPRR